MNNTMTTEELDRLEALARAAYLADERVVAMLQPAKVLDLITQARASMPADEQIVRRRTVTHPDGSTTTYISEYEHSLEMDLAECRDLFEVPESGELHDLWSEACSEPRAVAAYVKAQFNAIKALAAPTAAVVPSEQEKKDATRYRWLRDRANYAQGGRAPMVFDCDTPDEITWSDSRHGAELDAVMDVAMERWPLRAAMSAAPAVDTTDTTKEKDND